ncbi:hypothetical protein B0F90DRAFT_942658 [Multifurca ochricompacta]|uniref:Uncharacterized protein n=1 Tax=Multifurca ochricompacta TaxID=376703 RepID=A0AAD4MAA8_9AGAM|nr:hypothetical protein B0F90DRAFT_942658 [Multifurca ochricompacta]
MSARRRQCVTLSGEATNITTYYPPSSTPIFALQGRYHLTKGIPITACVLSRFAFIMELSQPGYEKLTILTAAQQPLVGYSRQDMPATLQRPRSRMSIPMICHKNNFCLRIRWVIPQGFILYPGGTQTGMKWVRVWSSSAAFSVDTRWKTRHAEITVLNTARVGGGALIQSGLP